MLENKWVKLILVIAACIVAWKLLELLLSLIARGAVVLMSAGFLLIPVAIGIGIGYLLFFKKKYK